MPGDNGTTTPLGKLIAASPTQPFENGEMSARYKRLYTWQCVVEYLKYMVKVLRLGISRVDANPLIGKGLLGDGPHLYRVGGSKPVPGGQSILRFAHH